MCELTSYTTTLLDTDAEYCELSSNDGVFLPNIEDELDYINDGN